MSAVAPPRARADDRRYSDEDIYGQVYTAIVEHHVAAGTKLPEDALCEVFGVSRTVVRKALARLAHEGLVSIRRNRGARVASPSVDEARSVFESRRLVEVAALEVVCQRASKTDLKRLRRLGTQEQPTGHSRSRRRAVLPSGGFHVELVAITGNGPLTEFVRQLVARTSLVIAMYGFAGGSRNSCHGHAPLLELLEHKDVPAAQGWLEGHLREIEGALEFGAGAGADLRGVFEAIRADRGTGVAAPVSY